MNQINGAQGWAHAVRDIPVMIWRIVIACSCRTASTGRRDQARGKSFFYILYQ